MSNIIENSVLGMMKGIDLATSLIRRTYGGAGSNVIIESKLNPGHVVTNDCDTIIQAMEFKDQAEKRGLGFLKELSSQQDKVAGNGRKTTILIADQILKEGYKSTLNKLQLKRELDALIPFIEEQIDSQTKQITLDDVKDVATTASESEEIGNLFQEIYKQIGRNGILNIEGSKTYETSYKITNGVKFGFTGMLSPEMVHNSKTSAIYEKPLILVTKKKIVTDDDVNPLLKEMKAMEKKDLIIFTNDMDSGIASQLVNLHKTKEYNVLVIKAPSLWQDYVFEDFAKCVGATIVEDKTGVSFKNLGLKHLGTCDRIEVDNEDTILTGIQDISEHCKQLSKKGDDDSLLRLSWLVSKSAILKLGANSSTDLSYKLKKAYDANRSTYLALQYGVVKGGGVCLDSISANLLPDDKLPSEAQSIMHFVLRAPMVQALNNYGISYGEYMELITDNIVDASMVVKKAVRNAIGIASTILTAPDMIFIPPLTPEEMAYNVSMKNNNPFNQ